MLHIIEPEDAHAHDFQSSEDAHAYDFQSVGYIDVYTLWRASSWSEQLSTPIVNGVLKEASQNEINHAAMPWLMACDYLDSVAEESEKEDFSTSFTWDGMTRDSAQARRRSVPQLQASDVVEQNGSVMRIGTGEIVKFKFSLGNPIGVTELDKRKGKWGRDMVLVAGRGKAILEEAMRTPDILRNVPSDMVRKFAVESKKRSKNDTATCMLCSRPLRDSDSVARGYGPECANKVR